VKKEDQNMSSNIKAIETVYQGYRFRSRLEARWAVFLTEMKIVWEYEKEGFDLGREGWYLPDFWLPKQDMWLEIKPKLEGDPDLKGQSLCYQLSLHTRKVVGLIQGNPAKNLVDGINCDFSFFLFGGLPWDLFIDDEPFPNSDIFEGSYFWGSSHFENLRQFVLLQAKEGKYLYFSDIEELSIHALDEVSRRRTIIELDKLYYHRKYNKEHPRWRSNSRICPAYFSGNGSVFPDIDDNQIYEELDVKVQKALEKARSARFEHGETP